MYSIIALSLYWSRTRIFGYIPVSHINQNGMNITALFSNGNWLKAFVFVGVYICI